jgi:GNAT acetyltransferase-like protein
VGRLKGPPRDGVVELGYEIAESRRERGLATAAVRAMVAEAFGDDGVEAVIAHTLAERNASNRVFEKVGFRFDGEARERDTPVWRYSLARPAGDASAGRPFSSRHRLRWRRYSAARKWESECRRLCATSTHCAARAIPSRPARSLTRYELRPLRRLAAHARLPDRRRFELLTERTNTSAALAALDAYRNADGG